MKNLASSLRTTLAVGIIGLAGMSLVVSGALIFLTTYLHQTSVFVRQSVATVRLAQQAEILLLLDARAQDPLLRQDLEHDLRRVLDDAAAHVATEEEGRLLREARAHVEAYLADPRGEGADRVTSEQRLASAFGALETLVDESSDRAEGATRRAERWDRFANVLGIVTIVFPLLIGGWLLTWQTRALRSLFALARTMEAFGHGDRDVRAEEAGPTEVREMAVRFNAMASALAAKRATLLTFLGGVAHDLRNPLGVLAISLGAVRPDRPLPPEPRIRRTFEVLERQIGHMERMLGDFLDTARLEAGKLEMSMAVHDARDLVSDVAGLFEATSPRHPVEITLPETEVPVRCDVLRLEQVITNLLSNAIKYSPEGGPIVVILARDGAEAVLRIKDHGLGISEDEQRRVFEPFHRERRAPAIPGAGLGLFAVKRIVEAHGGRIDVQSAPGCGSTFEVRLPIEAGGEGAG